MLDHDIVDAIDELVDAQMRQERSGYDHNLNQDSCPHSWCSEPWHGLAITKRMQEMRRKWRAAVNYYEDEDGVTHDIAAELDAYRYDQDDSEILCPGSSFVGEFTPPQLDPVSRGWQVFHDRGWLLPEPSWAVTVGNWELPPDPMLTVRPPTSITVDPTVTLFREGESGWQELGTIASNGIQLTPNQSSVEAWGAGETIRTDSPREMTFEFHVRDVNPEVAALFTGQDEASGWRAGDCEYCDEHRGLNMHGFCRECMREISAEWDTAIDPPAPGYDDGRPLTQPNSMEQAA